MKKKAFIVPTSIFILLALAGLLIYRNSLFNDFLFDDLTVIVNNHFIKSLDKIPSFFQGYIDSRWRFSGGYRPIPMVTLALNYYLSGLDPFPYHLFNLGVHILNSYLIFILSFAFLSSFFPNVKKTFIYLYSGAIALMFISNPIQAQSINMVWKRTGLLSSAVILSSMLAYFNFLKSDKRIWFLAVLFLQTIGFLCKEDTLIIPMLLLIIWGAVPDQLKSISKKKAIFSILISTFFSMFLYKLLRIILSTVPPTTSTTIDMLSPLQYFRQQAGIVVLRYLKMTIIPSSLAIDHQVPMPDFRSDITALLVGSAIIAFLIWSWRGKRRKLMAFCASAYFILLIPTTSFIPLATAMDEHRLYLPLGFYYLAMAAGFMFMMEKSEIFSSMADKAHAFLIIFFIFVSAVNGLGTFYRNIIWKNEYLLWKDALKSYPDSVRAYSNVAFWALKYGKFEEAKEMAIEAIKRNPRLKIPYISLSNAYVGLKDYDAAINVLKRVLQISPNYASAHYNIALLYLRKGDIKNAKKHAFKALEGLPSSYRVRNLVEKLEKEKSTDYFPSSSGGSYESNIPLCSTPDFQESQSEEDGESSLPLCRVKD